MQPAFAVKTKLLWSRARVLCVSRNDELLNRVGVCIYACDMKRTGVTLVANIVIELVYRPLKGLRILQGKMRTYVSEKVCTAATTTSENQKP